MSSMPSGRTHDAITFLLAAPAGAAAYAATRSVSASLIVAGAFVFGGLMFGPDLDTVSRQYSRWWVFRSLWYPYRSFFRHRSRFSHGLILGALIRVVYFLGVLTVVVFTLFLCDAIYRGGRAPGLADIDNVWQTVGAGLRTGLGEHFLLFIFLGLWLGAASHTFTDLAGSFVKTGRISKFL
jgi:uncharacterized metal-binding protein